MWLNSPHVNCSPTEPQELILTPGMCYKVTLLVSFPARPDGSHKPCSWLPLTASLVYRQPAYQECGTPPLCHSRIRKKLGVTAKVGHGSAGHVPTGSEQPEQETQPES